ncbi:nuclear transport factor 2 family protein [Streptomyces globisporus]
MSNKETLLTAMRELFHDKDVTALDRYWAEPYIQHSPNLPDGLDGLRAAVPTLEGFRWNPERVFEDGDFVIAHSRVSGWHPDGDAAIVDTSSASRTAVSSSTGTSSSRTSRRT